MPHEVIPFQPDDAPDWEPDVGRVNGYSPTDDAPEGLPVRFWSQLGDVAPPDRLVRRLLGEASLAMMFGEPGCGKTFLATDMGLHIALGQPWFGRPVSQGAVLYIAGEGLAGINNRLAGFRQWHKLKDDVPFAIVPTAVNLGPEGRDASRVIDASREVERRTGLPVKLKIIDTLARNMGAGDENAARDMGAFVSACDRIRTATSATVLIIHHSGKSQHAGARGSSALLGAVDTAMSVEKRDSGRAVIIQKQKDSPAGEEFGFSLDVVEIGEDDVGEAITTCVVKALDVAPQFTPRRRSPTGNAGVVFRALQKAVEDAGEAAPTTSHIPPSARVVSTDLWRRYAYEMMADATPDARQRAFRRAYDQLTSLAYATAWGSYAWVSSVARG